jgi:hypothetical protein
MNANYFVQVAERAIKTALQVAVALVTATSFDWFHADWKSLLATVATATAASVGTSLASFGVGPIGSPSIVPTEPKD